MGKEGVKRGKGCMGGVKEEKEERRKEREEGGEELWAGL